MMTLAGSEKPFIFTKDPVLLRQGAMRPEVAEELGMVEREALRLGPFAGPGIHGDPDQVAREFCKNWPFLFQRLHLGGAELGPLEG